MAQKLFTSKEWWEILDKLSIKLWIDLRTLVRIALALSLNKNKDSVSISENSKWREFNRYSLLGSEELFYKTILESLYKKQLSDDEFFWNSSVLKYHIDAWLKIIRDLYIDVNQDTPELIIKLLETNRDINNETWINTLGTYRSWKVYPLKISIGEDTNSKEVYIDLNNKEKHGNSHLAIMGKPWTWKTQLLLNILCQIREKSNFETNFIFFDYKWEDSIYKDPFLKYTKNLTYSFLLKTKYQ